MVPKVPKISLHIFAVAPKSLGDEVDFFPTDKHESFLQVDSISLCVHVCIVMHNQSILNSKFTISLQ